MDENRFVLLLETLRSVGLREDTLDSVRARMLQAGVPEPEVAQHLRDVVTAGRIWADHNDYSITDQQSAKALDGFGLDPEQTAQWYRYMYRLTIDSARHLAELGDADIAAMAQDLELAPDGLIQTFQLARAVTGAVADGFTPRQIAEDLAASGALPLDLALQTVEHILVAARVGTRVRAGESPEAILADMDFDAYPVFVLALAVGYGKEHKRFQSLLAGTRTEAAVLQLSH